jgi:hypothetical protein
VYLVLCWGPWSTWTWDLCRVINMDPFAFFYMQTVSRWAFVLLKMLSLPPHIVWLWLLCQKSSVHRCVGLFLGLRFYFIDQPVCFCTDTMWSFFFFPLLLCSTAWSQDSDSSSGSFTVQDCFGYPGLLFFQM